MQSKLSIKTVGLAVSAVLAVIYTLVMFASLLLRDVLTTGSWQAALLGIRWSTVVGFEIGLLGVVIIGFAVAAVFVPAYNAIRYLATRQSETSAQPDQPGRMFARHWAFRLLTALFLLLPITLPGLRAYAQILSSHNDSTKAQSPGTRTQAMNMGPRINTACREAEPSFTADGRTMYFNCYSYDICVSHLISTWEEGSWTTSEIVGAPISTAYEEIEPVITLSETSCTSQASGRAEPLWTYRSSRRSQSGQHCGNRKVQSRFLWRIGIGRCVGELPDQRRLVGTSEHQRYTGRTPHQYPVCGPLLVLLH